MSECDFLFCLSANRILSRLEFMVDCCVALWYLSFWILLFCKNSSYLTVNTYYYILFIKLNFRALCLSLNMYPWLVFKNGTTQFLVWLSVQKHAINTAYQLPSLSLYVPLHIFLMTFKLHVWKVCTKLGFILLWNTIIKMCVLFLIGE